MILIGIDAGKNTGISIYDSSIEKFTLITKGDFWQAINIISNRNDGNSEAVVIIEDVTQNKPVFGLVNLYTNTRGMHSQKLGAVASKAQNVGGVKKETELIIRYCEKYKIKVKKVKPRSKKIDNATFLRYLRGRTIEPDRKRYNEHERDSAMLIIK